MGSILCVSDSALLNWLVSRLNTASHISNLSRPQALLANRSTTLVDLLRSRKWLHAKLGMCVTFLATFNLHRILFPMDLVVSILALATSALETISLAISRSRNALHAGHPGVNAFMRLLLVLSRNLPRSRQTQAHCHINRQALL